MTLRHAWIVVGLAANPLRGAEPVDYARDVKPIFAAFCTSCHGPQKQKGDLRLDLYDRIKRGGNTGPAVVGQKSAESILYHALAGDRPDISRMPPKGDRLSPAQVALIKRWIDEGAKGPDKEDGSSRAGVASTHWSFQPIKRPALPQVKNAAWPRNAIDRFILARLEKEGITPSPEADRVTLIRRLSPRPDRPAADARRRSTRSSRTASPRRLREARRSAARVAALRRALGPALARRGPLRRLATATPSTPPRSIWQYRDWVINAFNRDLPFDQFTDRATRRRPAAQRRRRAADRHRLPPQHA